MIILSAMWVYMPLVLILLVIDPGKGYGTNANIFLSMQFLSGGQSEVEATLNLNAMNQSPNPWHVSFSYARALQNTVLKTWQGHPENVEAAQKALLIRAKANSLAQLGKYSAEGENEEAKKGMFVKGYTY